MRASVPAKVPNVTDDVKQSLENFRKHLQKMTDDVHSAFNQSRITLSENLPMESFKVSLNGGESKNLNGTKLFAGGTVISNTNKEATVNLTLTGGKLSISSDKTTSVTVVAFYSEGL